VAYSTAADVRRLTGVPSGVLSDSDLNELIADADATIDQEIGSFSAPVPRRVKRLASLLAAVDVFSRPELRGGFSAGDFSVSNEDIERTIERWNQEIQRIMAHYGSSLKRI